MMEKARFISIEDDEPDLILSFALSCENIGIKSLILMRTPIFEGLLPIEERGVQASLEGLWENDRNMLEVIDIGDSVVTISTAEGKCEIDISAIEQSDVTAMVEFTKRLNFDSCFKITVV